MLKKTILILLFISIWTAPSLQAGAEQKKEWVGQFYSEVLNKGNIHLMDNLVAANYQEHEPLPGFQPNRNGLKQFFAMMREAFPDLNNEVQFMVVEGDKVVSYITMTGTHEGDYMGAVATGKVFKIQVIDIIKVVNGKMTEHWGVGDYMTMMEQLGMGSQ
ncbi:MAG: ester cyclase [Thermodesulfobacteriota bacterium]